MRSILGRSEAADEEMEASRKTVMIAGRYFIGLLREAVSNLGVYAAEWQPNAIKWNW
jgi:hypothetical protein